MNKTSFNISTGSTAKLFAQILNKAPIDIFLSADQLTIEKIPDNKKIKVSKFTYAIGNLVIFSKTRFDNEVKFQNILLKRLSNKTHKLISGTVIAKNNKIVWKHRSEARMSMHKLSEKDIDDYLSATGKKILNCVGAYNIEGFGSNLFKKIDGDFFSIVGLPLIDLLNALRKLSKG